MIVKCGQCGVEFNKKISLIKKNEQLGYKHYCSNKCRHLGKRNKIIKKCIVCKKEMIIPASNINRYSTCSKQCRTKNRLGKNNSNYRDGNRNKRQRERHKYFSHTVYKNWRKSVFERDNYTCQFCKKRGGELHADHIKPWNLFPKLRFVITNGRTLCVKCHRTTFKRKKKESYT